MPMKSQAQRAFLHIHHPDIADRWEKETPKGKKLPKHVGESAPSMSSVFGEAEDTDREMARASRSEEQQAIRDYDRREQDAEDPELKKAFRHARGEEEEHDELFQKWLGEDGLDEGPRHLEKTPYAPEPDPDSYLTFQSPEGYHLLTPEGNEQWWPNEADRDRYFQWHQGMSGVQNIRQVEPASPKMAEVFQVSEAPIQNRPPPGSQLVNPTEWNKLGQMGQSLNQGLKAMQSAGQTTKVYKTPGGDRVAFPDSAAPGRGPLKADTTKGVWTPMTGSATGTPTPPATPFTTTVK
jgi:hypothetical protein